MPYDSGDTSVLDQAKSPTYQQQDQYVPPPPPQPAPQMGPVAPLPPRPRPQSQPPTPPLPEPFTTADGIQLARLQAGLSNAQQQRDDGFIDNDTYNAHVHGDGSEDDPGILKRIAALSAKKQQKEAQDQQKQKSQLMDMTALQEMMEQSHLASRAKAFPETVARFVDKLTGEVAHYIPKKDGGWEEATLDRTAKDKDRKQEKEMAGQSSPEREPQVGEPGYTGNPQQVENFIPGVGLIPGAPTGRESSSTPEHDQAPQRVAQNPIPGAGPSQPGSYGVSGMSNVGPRQPTQRPVPPQGPQQPPPQGGSPLTHMLTKPEMDEIHSRVLQANPRPQFPRNADPRYVRKELEQWQQGVIQQTNKFAAMHLQGQEKEQFQQAGFAQGNALQQKREDAKQRSEDVVNDREQKRLDAKASVDHHAAKQKSEEDLYMQDRKQAAAEAGPGADAAAIEAGIESLRKHRDKVLGRVAPQAAPPAAAPSTPPPSVGPRKLADEAPATFRPGMGPGEGMGDKGPIGGTPPAAPPPPPKPLTAKDNAAIESHRTHVEGEDVKGAAANTARQNHWDTEKDKFFQIMAKNNPNADIGHVDDLARQQAAKSLGYDRPGDYQPKAADAHNDWLLQHYPQSKDTKGSITSDERDLLNARAANSYQTAKEAHVNGYMGQKAEMNQQGDDFLTVRAHRMNYKPGQMISKAENDKFEAAATRLHKKGLLSDLKSFQK